MLLHHRSGKLALSVSWVPAPDSELERNSKAVTHSGRGSVGKKRNDLPGVHLDELDVLLHALELVKTRTIWKIAVCQPGRANRCGKWFFKKFRHQQFCSEKCRISAFRDSDEARAKRNEYARNLYHLHKSGSVK